MTKNKSKNVSIRVILSTFHVTCHYLVHFGIRPIIFCLLQDQYIIKINWSPVMLGSFAPTMNLYVNSYMKSPNKYANQSTLISSPHKNQNTAITSSILSPLKDQKDIKNRNLSSLILMASPAKSPHSQKNQFDVMGSLEEKDKNKVALGIQMIALNLSGNIFMNSTTKFMKGFDSNIGNTLISPNKEKKNNANLQKNKNPIVYPSKQKIERIIKGNTIKPQNNIQTQRSASQKLQQTLNRNRIHTQKSNLDVSKNQSRSQRSRSQSGSVRRLTRRKQKVRQLKFLQKKQRSETSINITNIKQSQKVAVSDASKKHTKNIDGKILNSYGARAAVNEVKSTDAKKIEKEEISRPSNRQTNNVRPLHYVTKNQKNTETTPSILSNISEKQKASVKRQGFSPIVTLNSGQLPIQTPVKPSPLLLKSESSKSIPQDQILSNKTNNVRGRLQVQQIVSQIKEEKSSEIQTKNSVKSKQILFNGSVKEEASTYVQQDPTEVAVCAVNDNNNSKFSKNQSTKAFGNSVISKIAAKKMIKTQPTTTETPLIQPKRLNTRKVQPAKPTPLQPIPTSSVLSEKKQQAQSTLNKRNIKTEAKEETSSKISIQERTLTNNKHLSDKELESVKIINPSLNLKKSLSFTQVFTKYYVIKLTNAFTRIKEWSKFANIHIKEAQILLRETANIYKNLYSFNMRTSVEQLKKLSLANPLNKRPALTSQKSKNIFTNLIFRILSQKYRERFLYLKQFSWKNKPLPQISLKQIQQNNTENDILRRNVISQLIKIVQNYQKNRIRTSFSKLNLYANSTIKTVQKQQPIVATRSPSKYTKLSRDYQAERNALNNSKQQLQSQIYRLQSRMANKKRTTDQQRSKLLKKQDDLNKKNKTLDGQVLEKRKKNKLLKGKVQQSNGNQDYDICLPQCEPLIGTLTEIYSIVFRNSNETIDTNQLAQKYSLTKEDQNPLLQEWSSLAQNINLKSQIAKWEGEGKLHRSKEILLAQQQLIKKVLGSYVRERYLWEWVRVAAETL